MRAKITSLYKNSGDRVIEEYSKFKFGCVSLIDYLAEEMAELILGQISKKQNYVIYTTNKFPTKNFYKKNSLILAEKIAEKLKLPLVIGEYRYCYNKKTFYDLNRDRNIPSYFLPEVKNEDKLKFKKYTFLMIDDSIVTKTTLKASLKILKDITNKVNFFSVINLKGGKYRESEANDYYYKKNGVNCLIDLLNSDRYILTTHMLRTIDTLKNKELKFLSVKITEKSKKLLTKSFKKYIGKDLHI
ncbi:phosphoribosyltransferase [Candidatus Uhrbacteria bacterium]|nr:phosphoribosyltransferase [Candidatus Uhrbacteria bacterium]